MAGAARLDDRLLGELVLRRDVFHDRVAVGAREVAGLVGAALPEEPGTLRMAREADLVALHERRLVVLCEGDQPAHAFAAPRLGVSFAGPVAGLACQPFRAVARLVEEEAAHPRLRERLRLVLMATLA